VKLRKSQRYYIYARDGKRCRYCDRPITFKQMTVDHLYPRGRGGATEVFNLVACCRHCNKEKHDRIPPDAEKTQIELFQKAVADGIILPDKSKIKEWEPDTIASVDTMYAAGDGTVFEGGGYRYLVRRHRIVQVVRFHVHGD
jgi:hypothetical protein